MDITYVAIKSLSSAEVVAAEYLCGSSEKAAYFWVVVMVREKTTYPTRSVTGCLSFWSSSRRSSPCQRRRTRGIKPATCSSGGEGAHNGEAGGISGVCRECSKPGTMLSGATNMTENHKDLQWSNTACLKTVTRNSYWYRVPSGDLLVRGGRENAGGSPIWILLVNNIRCSTKHGVQWLF